MNPYTYEALYREGHGATNDYIGYGMLYYAITYVLKAELCVCLGSGGGFVPRCMRMAQRDLKIGRTVLVDAGNGVWGKTTVHNLDSWFRKNYPDIEVWKMLTTQAASQLKDIGYLHIDADHSYVGVSTDFFNYARLLVPNGVISMHDTRLDGVRQFLGQLNHHWQVFELPMWQGLALIRRANGMEIS